MAHVRFSGQAPCPPRPRLASLPLKPGIVGRALGSTSRPRRKGRAKDCEHPSAVVYPGPSGGYSQLPM